MDESKQERIRQRAHELWEAKGRPHGDHEADWHQAVREIEDSDHEQTTTTEQVAGKAELAPATDGGPAAGAAESGVRGNEQTAAGGPPASRSPAPKAL